MMAQQVVIDDDMIGKRGYPRHYAALGLSPPTKVIDDSGAPVDTTPASALVNGERTRRIVAGRVIDGIYVTGRDEDARNLTNMALAASLRIAAGDETTLTTYRDGNNDNHDLTPPQMLSLWQKSAAYVSALYEASWAIKAMDPFPADYEDDKWWPIRT